MVLELDISKIKLKRILIQNEPHIKINSKWFIEQSVNPETIKLLGENVGKIYPWHLGLDRFLRYVTKRKK